MTQPLTDQQLNDIAARHQAATKGPWGAYTFGGDSLIEIAADLEDTGTGYRARREICRLEDEPLDNDPAHRDWSAEEDWAQVQADAAFIAHAPDDVAVLLAGLRRLRGELADFRQQLVAANDTAEALRAESAETAARLATARQDLSDSHDDLTDALGADPHTEWVDLIRAVSEQREGMRRLRAQTDARTGEGDRALAEFPAASDAAGAPVSASDTAPGPETPETPPQARTDAPTAAEEANR